MRRTALRRGGRRRNPLSSRVGNREDRDLVHNLPQSIEKPSQEQALNLDEP